VNRRLRMTHLRLHETPKLGVHQTGSSSIADQVRDNKLNRFEAYDAFACLR